MLSPFQKWRKLYQVYQVPLNYFLQANRDVITKTSLYKYTENFTTQKWKIISKNSRLGEAVLTSTHNLCFRAEIRKIMYTPVNPSFTV